MDQEQEEKALKMIMGMSSNPVIKQMTMLPKRGKGAMNQQTNPAAEIEEEKAEEVVMTKDDFDRDQMDIIDRVIGSCEGLRGDIDNLVFSGGDEKMAELVEQLLDMLKRQRVELMTEQVSF